MTAPNTSQIAGSALWSPLDIGGMRVRHRVMTTGHTLLYGVDGVLSQRHIDYYRERAAGGTALIVTEQQAAHPSGANYLQGCRAYDSRAIAGYRRLAEAVRPHDTRLLVQLFCGGAQGSGTMYIDDWRPLWAPSAIASTQFHEQPAVMNEDDVHSIIEGFVVSARNAQEGECDGVEIHAAHSQLLGAFLSPAFNRRTDRYGGSALDRCRIVLDIGEAVRRSVGSRFALGLRLSIDERLANGAGITEDNFLVQLEHLAAAGLFDFYDLSAGGFFAKHVSVTPMTSDLPAAFLAPAAARAKRVVGNRGRIFVVGRIFDIATASRVIDSGDADMVAMTRAQMADPHLVRKAQAGRERDIVRCVGAGVCTRRLGENNHVACAVNPALGREATFGDGTLEQTAHPKRLVVVGGGPAGIRFAGTAAARGHAVTLIESAGQPGGRLRMLASLPGRERWAQAIQDLRRTLEVNRVVIAVGQPADAAAIARLTPDMLVFAVGARFEITGYSAYRPERTSIPGATAPRVIGIDAAIERTMADPAALGHRVVIVDDGHEELTAGIAERLSSAGSTVVLVTPRAYWGEALYRTYDIAHVLPRLRDARVEIVAQHFVERIEGDMIELYDLWHPAVRRRVAVDTVILALGREPAPMPHVTSKLPIHRIGDCVAPRSVEAVIFEGEQRAREL